MVREEREGERERGKEKRETRKRKRRREMRWKRKGMWVEVYVGWRVTVRSRVWVQSQKRNKEMNKSQTLSLFFFLDSAEQKMEEEEQKEEESGSPVCRPACRH